jgi:DNA-binding NarL/FixJ family response regulator
MAAGATPIRVLLVDDHDLIREGLRPAFDRTGGELQVVGEARYYDEAVDALEELSPDVLVTDLRLKSTPGEGIRLVEYARRRFPDIGIVVLTMYGDDQHLLAAREAKASAFVAKDQPSRDVVEAARRAAVAPHSFNAPNRDAGRPIRSAAARRPQLTPRELEVLGLVAKGLVIEDIAAVLFISYSTAKTHVQKIYKKLGAVNRTQAVMTAMKLGLLPGPEFP